jgi:hypothetical protein
LLLFGASAAKAEADLAIPVRVLAHELPLLLAPDANSGRRGTLKRGALTFIHSRRRAGGCAGPWALVGASAWTCELPGVFAERSLRDRAQPDSIDGTEFARIGDRGALGYDGIEKAAQQLPDAELQPGFLIAVVEERTVQGEAFVRTTHDVWIARRDLIPVVPSSFEGIEIEQPPERGTLDGSVLPFGWVYVAGATPRRKVGGASIGGASIARLTLVQVLELQHHADHHDWYRTPKGWFSDQQLRVPSVREPPDAIQPRERWLDVDRHTQTLVAYTGQTPVFATLVSTGRGPDNGPNATPTGVFRIWVKLISTDMDNLDERHPSAESSDAPEPYDVEAVPFVMFFLRGYGLHGTYWHDGFGAPKSHGCVNLSLRDAARIFEFSSPKLGPGWQAVHPYVYDPGTLVRVR